MNTYHPMLFQTEMVKAILEGRKKQTRRIVKTGKFLQSDFDLTVLKNNVHVTMKDGIVFNTKCGKPAKSMQDKIISCPYGKEGDILWVRETFVKAMISEDGESPIKGESLKYWYAADNEWTKHEWQHDNKDDPQSAPKWKPSIHMPKEACRLFLRIRNIKVERVQDISEEDATMEGAPFQNNAISYDGEHYKGSYKNGFKTLWQSINGKESWERNPFVWCISFERIEKPDDFLN